MLLTQYKRIQTIDKQLTRLHNERAKLYSSATFDRINQASSPSTTTPNLNPDKLWTRQIYSELANKWQAQGIIIPSYKKLQAKLELAQLILSETSAIKPELQDKMTAVLVPPTKYFKYSLATDLGEVRGLLHLSSDFLAAKFRLVKNAIDWSMVIVYSESEGQYIATPQQLLNNQPYVLGGYNVYGLGTREYSALVIQEASTGFDESTWTILLKDCKPQDPVIPSVKFETASYVFGVDNADSPFGDIRFRPAIAINRKSG